MSESNQWTSVVRKRNKNRNVKPKNDRFKEVPDFGDIKELLWNNGIVYNGEYPFDFNCAGLSCTIKLLGGERYQIVSREGVVVTDHDHPGRVIC